VNTHLQAPRAGGSGEQPRHALVFGATGFIGRHLVLALDDQDVAVQAAVRSHASYLRMAAWLQEHGCRLVPTEVLVDFEAPRLGCGDAPGLAQVTEVHNCAGAYRFGMDADEARHANVDAVARSSDWPAGLPHLRRIVHVSGYRVGGQEPAEVPWSAERRHRTYAALGAYEASKVESDAVFQHDAAGQGCRGAS
jgi:nucleoside-diphosphate-sugar epimerase